MQNNDQAPAPLPARGTFEPGRHLTRVNGNDYLEVKWRLVWLRDDAPDSQIVTELIESTADFSLCKATVTKIIDGEIRGVATGYGSETSGDFRDHLEKSESKAIGRALAHLGYGTQFAVDHEAATDRPGNPPVPIRQANRPAAVAPPRGQQENPGLLTPRQQQFLEDVAIASGRDLLELDELARDQFNVPYRQLNRADCSALIQWLQRAQP